MRAPVGKKTKSTTKTQADTVRTGASPITEHRQIQYAQTREARATKEKEPRRYPVTLLCKLYFTFCMLLSTINSAVKPHFLNTGWG